MKWSRHLLANDFIWLIVAALSFLVVRQSGTTIMPLLRMGAFIWLTLWAYRLFLFHHKESPPEGWIYWLHMGMSRTGILLTFSGGWAIISILFLALILPPADSQEWLELMFIGLYGVVTFLSWWNFGLPGLVGLFYVPVFLSLPLIWVLKWQELHGFSVPIPSYGAILSVLSGVLVPVAVWLYVLWLKKDLT